MTTATTKRSPSRDPLKLEPTVLRQRVALSASILFPALSQREFRWLHVVWSGLSYSSWKSLFLYLCFNEVTFGPLRSQRASSSSLTPGKGEGASEALSCSPKSLYHLARLVGCMCCQWSILNTPGCSLDWTILPTSLSTIS